MADYWKRRLEELNQTTTKKSSTGNYWDAKVKESEESKKTTTDIAPVKNTSTKKDDDRKWFQKGAFEDGYQFGDIYKTVSGTAKDVQKNLMSGILGIGEKVVDAGAYAVGAVGGLVSDDFKESTKDFIAKDLYDEKAVAEKIIGVTNPIGNLWTDDEDSVLGDKSDSVIESGGQLLGTAALQAVGVPWFLTTGVTAFGSEAENALGQGAGYGAAGLSAAISAGAEILTEKISGGIKFGGSTLDEGLTHKLALGISNKALRTMTKLGMDIAGEGSEEVISQFFSNLGTSLYREESLSDILFSEDALDEYLESFIGGAALGGAGGGFNAVNSAVHGVDATSGMTENEEKVFKKVYEDRVAEAGGEKLTTREKNKIYEEVERDMERGYISTDTIEEVLGGNSYKAYKDTVANEDALRKEFDALGDTKESELTVKQRERYNELKAKIAEMESGNVRAGFKAELDGEMQRLTEGSRLAESYAEKSRRGEQFTADMTLYDEKQKAVVQKAIDSGILNNSNRTHEFVDMVAKISAEKGVLFDFTNNAKLKDSGFAVDGKAVNGFVTKDGVTVNIDSQKSLNSVVGHEITHVLEGTELYTELSNVVVEYAKTKGEYQGRYDSLSELYKDIEGADVDAELTADLVGDYLFTDEDFVNNLSVQNRNVFQKIYDEIKYLYKVATAGSKEARELERVKRAFDKAYKSGGKVAQTKYSVSDKNIKDVSTGYGYGETYFTMSYTQDGKVVGTLEYGEYDGEANVKMIQVLPEYRRRGIGTKLMQELQKKYPDTEIDFGMSTPDGTNLLNAITYDVTDEAVASDRQKLTDLQTELNELQGKLDVLYDTENLTEAQDKELHELGDRWQEVYEAIGKLEKDLRGKRATKTFVKTEAKYSLADIKQDMDALPAEDRKEVSEARMRANYSNSLAAMTDSRLNRAFADYSYPNPTSTKGYFAYIDPVDFLSLTTSNVDEFLRNNTNKLNEGVSEDWGTENNIQESGILYLKVDENGNVIGHEGRHRMAALHREGVEKVAVIVETPKVDGAKPIKIKKLSGQDFGSTKSYGPVYLHHLLPISKQYERINRYTYGEVAEHNSFADPNIRYSLSEDSEGRKLTDEQSKYFKGSKVVDDSGKLKVVYHGSPADFNTFSLEYLGTNGTNEGYGFYFTDTKRIADGYSKGENGNGKLFEVYLDIKKPLSDKEVTISRAQFKKFLLALNNQVDADGERLDILSNYGDVEWEGLQKVVNYAMELEYDGNDNDVDIISSIVNSCGNLEAVYRVLREVTGYDGIIVNEAEWGGDQTIYIAFHPEQIKNADNLNPTSDPDIRRSVSRVGETAKKHGRYHIKGEDVRLHDLAPVQDSVQDATSSKTEQVAPVKSDTESGRLAWYNRYGEKVRDVPVMDDAAPSEPSLPQLREELAEIERQAVEIYKSGDVDALTDIGERHSEITAKIAQMEADESARVDSLSDADAPPETDAPYAGEGIAPVDPFAARDIKDVGDRGVKAYMYENPEVKPFFQEEANILLGELRNTTKGERFYTPTEYSSEYGAESYGVWTGTSRQTTDDIAYLLDTLKYSYADIEKGLNAIIEDNGKENNAISKRIEFLLNDRLMKGHRDIDGYEIPPNQDYINLLNEKQITEYNDEARRTFFESVGASNIAPVAEKYEAIRPKKETKEPRMKRVKDGETSHDGKERKWYGTSTSSEAVDGMVTPDDIPDDVRYYQVKSNKKTLATANERLARDGYAKSREYFEGRMHDKKLTVEDIALGERLIQEAAKAGDAKAVRDLIIDVSILGTELGQRVQALSIIRRLTPEGQLKALQRTISRAKAKGDKAFDGVELTEDMAQTILDTKKADGTFDQTELNAAVEDAKQKIADQMQTGVMDYINAWRYLSMLGNPKTHIRNLVSNVAMYGTRAVKNAVARTAEDVFLHGAKPNLSKNADIAPVRDTAKRGEIPGQQTMLDEGKRSPTHARTKTWRRSTDAVKAFAKKTTAEMKTAIMGEHKYSEAGSIKEKRNIFKTRAGNALANANTAAMEWEDSVFSKDAFRHSLQEYLTANGVKTEADIENNPELIERAKDYALDEAHKATFRQDSYMANKIAEIEQKNPLYGLAIGSVMPFKKTPINIAKTGAAYSPLGFARSVYDRVQVKKGNMDVTEAIDHLAQALTGTSIMLIGYALAESGILNGAGDDDKEGKYDYQLGKQSYSFNFNGNTFSLSWLSPVSMPLFVGANAYETLVEKNEWDANVVIDTLAQTLDPMSEMSFLSSLDDVLSSYDSGIKKISGAFGSMVQNYATQFVPTLSSQIAATTDNVKRSTKASATSGFEFGEETLNKIAYKIPGLRNKLQPTTDIWGNKSKQTENLFARAFESFLSPANKRAGISTAVDDELKSLYRETGETELIPSIPYDYINYKGMKYDMSAKEHTAYKQTYGQTALDMLERLFATNTYRSATAAEKADMVGRVYDYARDAAKREYLAGIDLDYTNAKVDDEEVFKEDPIKGAIEADMPVDEYVFSVENPEKYKFFNDNGISYATYKAADEDEKRAYTWAYENPGKYTMSKVISHDFLKYYGYKDAMNDFDAKDKNGETVSGLKKERVIEYINGLNLDYGQKIILFRSMYDSKEDKANYNRDIVDYLNGRDDISYKEMETILKELGFEVDSEGNISW